jgi:hypothetical protein
MLQKCKIFDILKNAEGQIGCTTNEKKSISEIL